MAYWDTPHPALQTESQTRWDRSDPALLLPLEVGQRPYRVHPPLFPENRAHCARSSQERNGHWGGWCASDNGLSWTKGGRSRRRERGSWNDPRRSWRPLPCSSLSWPTAFWATDCMATSSSSRQGTSGAWAGARGPLPTVSSLTSTLPRARSTSPPALELVLAPILFFAQVVGLTAHFPGGHPLGLWLLLGPAVLLMASPALFAIDAVARSWSLTDGSRLALALASALGVANVAGIWGHPEDCVAVAMVVWAALAVERRPDTGGRRAAWLLGLGIAFQPLAILGVAPVLACLGWRSFAKVSWRLLLPSLLVLVTPLIGQPGLTRFVLVKQPFLPHYVSFTPLTYLAPVIGPGTDGGGPTRLVALLLSACLAIAVCRRRHDLPTVLTMTAIAFFLRVLFETELNWYYMWPVAAVCLVLSARRGVSHLGVCSAALVATIVLGNHDAVHNIALWWPGLMASLAVMLGSTAGRVGLHQAHGSAHARTHATEVIAGIPAYTHTASLEATC